MLRLNYENISNRLRFTAGGCQHEDSANSTIYGAWRVIRLAFCSTRRTNSYYNVPSELARTFPSRAARISPNVRIPYPSLERMAGLPATCEGSHGPVLRSPRRWRALVEVPYRRCHEGNELRSQAATPPCVFTSRRNKQPHHARVPF